LNTNGVASSSGSWFGALSPNASPLSSQRHTATSRTGSMIIRGVPRASAPKQCSFAATLGVAPTETS